MSIVDFPEFAVRYFPGDNAAPSLSAFLLNASGDKVGMIIQVPKTGTLDWFEVRIGTVGNNPDNGVRFSFQDVDLTTGLPDGSVDQFAVHAAAISSNTWITPDNAMTNTGAGGGVKRSVTKGDFICCVIDFVTFVASDSFNVSMLANMTDMSNATDNENWYVADGTTGTYSKSSAAQPLLALKYSDGTYGTFGVPVWPILTINTRTYNNGSTPDEIALKFQVPISVRVTGVMLRIDLDGPADLILYDNSSTPLGTISVDNDVRWTTSPSTTVYYFTSSVTLTAATNYRLSVKPTSATSLTIYDFDVNSSGLLACIPGGTTWFKSSRTDAGAWDDSATANTPMIGLVCDGIESDSTPGGGETAAVF